MVRNRSRKPAASEALSAATVRWNRIFREALVVTGRSPAPALISVAPLAGNSHVTVHTFDLAKSSIDLPAVEAAETALRVVGHYDILEVRRSYHQQHQVEVLTAQAPDLPESVDVDYKLMDATAGLPFALGDSRDMVSYDPGLHGNLYVAGAAGSGKSALLQGLIIAAVRRGHDVYVGEVPRRGADFAFLTAKLTSLATSVADVHTMISRISAESRRREALLTSHGATAIDQLPPHLQPRPMMLVLDEFSGLIPEDSRVVTRWGIGENTTLTEIIKMTVVLAQYGQRLGLTVVLCSQQLDKSDLRRVPEAEGLLAKMSKILLGTSTSLSRMMILSNEEAAPPLGDKSVIGRGIFEPRGSTGIPVQCWYDSGWGSAVKKRHSQVTGAGFFAVASPVGTGADHTARRIQANTARVAAEERIAHLKLPMDVRNLAYLESGLIVVAGEGRSGKSNTLAALGSLAAANTKLTGGKVTTISCARDMFDSPLLDENVDHRPAAVEHYTACIRAAVGTRTKVLLIDERVTPEVFEAALDAANAGVLVLVSMHLPPAPIFDYVESAFPEGRQVEIQAKAAAGLRACVHQHLVPTKDGRGRNPEFRIGASAGL